MSKNTTHTISVSLAQRNRLAAIKYGDGLVHLLGKNPNYDKVIKFLLDFYESEKPQGRKRTVGALPRDPDEEASE